MAERMEEERKIEKLLRAYAKKRRADAGDPLKLPPATRRLLQDEVKRLKPKPDEDDSLSLWELFRQQWVFLLGFALVIFFVATMFLPALSSAKKKAQNVSALNNLKQIGFAVQLAAGDANGQLPASLDALTNQFNSPAILTDPQSGQPFVYVAGNEDLGALRTNAVLAYSPEDKNGRAVLLADGTVEQVDRARFRELTNQPVLKLALAKERVIRGGRGFGGGDIPAPVAAPSSPAPATASTLRLTADNSAEITSVTAPVTAQANNGLMKAERPQLQVVQQLAQAQFKSIENLFRNNSAAAKTSPVLANFQVQQTGNELRVLDGDGSVYDGSLTVANATDQMGPSGSAGTREQTARPNPDAVGGEFSAAQNYFFRVTGMNQTLKQKVVFSGNLMMFSKNTDASRMVVTNSLKEKPGQPPVQEVYQNRPQAPVWPNVRIAGTAVVSGTNVIEIDATSP
jgi:hypothetical protein